MLFSYQAIDKNGTSVRGTYEASERAQVVAYLKSQHMTPVSINNGRSTSISSMLPKKKTKAKDLSMFCEQFCSLLRAGVTIVDALRLLLEQTKDKALHEAIQTTIVGVNEGESLAVAMSKSSGVFDDTLVSLIRAGEASGSLDSSLERMGEQYKKDAEIAAAIKKAMMYPIIVLIIALIVVIFMLVYIVPSFMSMFEEVGMEMPGITLAVVAASDWLMKNYLIAIVVVVLVVAGIVAFTKSKTGKKCTSWLALKIPGINNFVIKSSASKIARTLSTLLTAGMTVIEALAILETTLPNYYYQEAIRKVREEVLMGQPMSRKFIENDKLFPSMLSHMIAVGEDTGDITSMLMRTADYYDLEVETATETMMSLMQPMIIVFLTGIVGVVLAAVLAPMVSMYTQLGDSL
jgi:type IV pilus assembly protein PilC